MKKKFKRIQVFLVLATSLLILAYPAYLRCNKLSQIRFVRSDLSFENPDQQEELSNKEKELKGFRLTTSFTLFFLGTKLLDQSSYLSPLPIYLPQEIVILRC